MVQLPTTSAETAQPASKDAVVRVQALNKTFKDFWLRTRAKAVDNLTFQVNKGEVFGLLGPNGSGKSTTIKVMLGLLKPTSGRVTVFGKLPTDVAIKKRIGYLPEESYLYPFLNARETLDYYGKLFQIDRATRLKRIDELLEMVGLASVQYRAVKEYSKGMQRRIGLAQALINDPELLILDEPTTGLDPIGSRQVKDLIIELGRRGKSIVLSSHLLADVEDCVHRMTILYGGKKQAEGTCDQLLESQDKSIIETDRLDDETVRQIDELIRRRTGSVSGIGKLTKPRQRLEDLFVDIVNKATAQRIETAGAKHGGQTAEFLRATEGDALLQSLTREQPELEPVKKPEAPVPVKGPDASLLQNLSQNTPPMPPKPEAPAPKPGGTIDRGLLDQLSGREDE